MFIFYSVYLNYLNIDIFITILNLKSQALH